MVWRSGLNRAVRFANLYEGKVKIQNICEGWLRYKSHVGQTRILDSKSAHFKDTRKEGEMKTKGMKKEYSENISKRLPYSSDSKLKKAFMKDLEKLNITTLVELNELTKKGGKKK